ncbi:TetR/AcrR family transcriptional regulator [Tatumella citrea]|uniref:TetR family transcriptional regulator n=1 Tax=Tatumella citrea TaxID=53336 RepID=A0A1Y0LLB1_TATCI|nr:TetR/AcrR family transcriptional regulator [Tatumella citrea]ARU94421.1 TetR family transcriptional regulator [Tatumella citrea]ARU98460.1 TetR family transcriptional regulator [Tatumella citrea]
MSTRGRPRKFDRLQALEKILIQFREKGYEGATLVDLITAAGIAPPSFYAAFGSKQAVFCEAVDHYIATTAAPVIAALQQETTLHQALSGMLQQSIEVALSCQPGGCLLIVGVVNCLPENQQAREYLKSMRALTRRFIRERAELAREQGEIRSEADCGLLADYFHGVMQMISLQAREGATRNELLALIAPALQSLSFFQ